MDLHVLNDGTEVVIRPIRADDGERLKAAHGRLSPEARYRRFLSAKPTLTSGDTRYLVEIDGSDHVALVATAPDDSDDGAIVAVARYVRVPEDPSSAEIAIVVGDRYQRHGLAKLLLAQLASIATEHGVQRFRATMLTENIAIYRLLEQLAHGEMQVARRGSLTELELRLVPDSEKIAAWGGS
jgi:RimJ/RimL family protein N-acetyltransferase